MLKINNNIKKIIISTILIIIFLHIGISCNTYKNNKPVKKYSITKKSERIDNLTVLTLYTKLQNNGIKYSDIIVAQSIQESYWFKSELSKKNKNLFGMKMPGQRKTTAISKTKDGYAIYNNWYDSVDDFLIWHKKYCYNMSRKEYLEYISKRYSNDSVYIKKIYLLNIKVLKIIKA